MHVCISGVGAESIEEAMGREGYWKERERNVLGMHPEILPLSNSAYHKNTDKRISLTRFSP